MSYASTIRNTMSDNPDLQQFVLNAAKACYLRFGIGKTTAADIAREAGISRATLYRRFPSHADIFLAVLAQESLDIVKACESQLEGIEDPTVHVIEGMLIVLDEIPRRPLHAHLFDDAGGPWVFSQTMPAENLHSICVEMLLLTPGLKLVKNAKNMRRIDFLAEWIVRQLASYAIVPSHIARNRNEMRELLYAMLEPTIRDIFKHPVKTTTRGKSKR